MGTDNLFHKNRRKTAKALERLKDSREKHTVIMIISEGKKTEPYYFAELIKHLGLNKASVFIPVKYGGNDPKKLAGMAKEEFENDPQGYNRVFVVFDRDTHTTFAAAIEMISKLNKKHKDKFKAIISVPCFELWLVLHFKFTAKPYQSLPGAKSVCDCVTDDLKKHIQNYEKGSTDTFKQTKHLLDDAIGNAEKLEKDRKSAGTDNPSTNVHHLIKYLREELDK
ncbi:MAG: RloB domain-containing protein [Nitrospirae bacterium]|nr:RloB domain-containing protein [Nitrospirota bacterium]